MSERKLVRGISRSPRSDLILKPALETFIAKASPLTRETFASPFVPVKVSDLMMVGSRASWLAKTVEPVIFCVRNSPLTVEPSLSVALAETTASSVAMAAKTTDAKTAAMRCFMGVVLYCEDSIPYLSHGGVA